MHPARYDNCKAVQYGISTPNSHILSSSSEDSLLQVKEPSANNSDTSYSGLGTDLLSRQKCYMCSVCKMQSPHISSVYRHVRNVHRHSKASVISVKHKMSVQTSRLALRRKTAKSWKRSTQTARDDSSGLEVGMQNSVKTEVHNMPSNSDNFRPTRTARDASFSYCTPVQHLPVCLLYTSDAADE